MKPENKGKRVRGYVVAASHDCGCVGKDRPGCITAYTYWYRHDDDLQQLERDLQAIKSAYMRMQKTGGMMYGYEYEDYKR